jgi:hypothetical protein
LQEFDFWKLSINFMAVKSKKLGAQALAEPKDADKEYEDSAAIASTMPFP